MALKKCIECKKDVGGKVKKCPHCGTDQRKWYDRHPIIVVFTGIILFIIITNILIPKSPDSTSSYNSLNSTTTNTIPDDNNTTMNKDEFDRIRTGMSYKEVVSIVGCEGTVSSESGVKGEPSHIVLYSWQGHGTLGANANAMFQADKLYTKAQFGLN